MFNRDFWSEIFMALKRNKLRTVLTGFAISWGIFMLIILLSAGNGLKNGVTSNFADRIRLHPENAPSPISSTLSGTVTVVNCEHPANASPPMLVTLSGIVTLVRPLQL